MDGVGMLHMRDELDLIIAQAVSRQATREWEDRVHRQAIEISNAVWEAVKDA
jgi:hypothetical protein